MHRTVKIKLTNINILPLHYAKAYRAHSAKIISAKRWARPIRKNFGAIERLHLRNFNYVMRTRDFAGVQLGMTTTMNLSTYAEQLPPEARKRYLDKTQIIAGIDPFTLACNQHGQSNNSAAQPSSLPSLDASDLVSYLVLQTSYVSAKQFKAHKSMEAYNQFFSGWVKEVRGWSILDKTVVIGRVSFSCNTDLNNNY